MKPAKLIVFIVFIAAVASVFIFDLHRHLDFAAIKAGRHAFDAYVEESPVFASAVYFALYVAVTALSLPGAAVLTLIGGFVFGLVWGVALVSFASSLGALLAFWVARFLLRDFVKKKYPNLIAKIDRGIVREGAFYLFALRLVPLFPFFAINLGMGLTALRSWTFYWVSQIGMFAGTVCYVNAGAQLENIETPSDILTAPILLSFALLGLFPLIARLLLKAMKARKVYRSFKRPKKFDRNLIVIGAGSGGLVSSYLAAAMKSKVTLIERHRMGGDCLNTGCVPSKALIRSARFVHEVQNAEKYGCKKASVEFDFAAIMERVQGIIGKIEPHDSMERYEGLGVECIAGEAELVSPWEVRVGDRSLTARSIVIATGGRPAVPKVDGIEDTGFYNSDTIWELRQQPQHLAVIGGGPIGCELAQCMARLGSRVTQFQSHDRLLPREDPEASKMVTESMTADGVEVLTGVEVRACRGEPGNIEIEYSRDGKAEKLACDAILVAVGRRANSAAIGLEKLGIRLRDNGTIEADEYLRTSMPHIYAVGDVTGPWQFTHMAAHQAGYAAINALLQGWWSLRADYSLVPWATFTDPEVAHVGLNELAARDQGVEYEVTHYGYDELDRALAESEETGFVKVLTEPGKDRILGVTLVGAHASDIIVEFISAMKLKAGLNSILGTIHIYPTFAEANKFAAGNWRKAHTPAKALEWLGRFHRWRLS